MNDQNRIMNLWWIYVTGGIESKFIDDDNNIKSKFRSKKTTLLLFWENRSNTKSYSSATFGIVLLIAVFDWLNIEWV